MSTKTRFELAELPYALDALEPHVSAETLRFHYEKHHAGYVKKLNAALEDEANPPATLEDLIRTAKGGVFENGAQVWNHTFYWNSMAPGGTGVPGSVEKAIREGYGGMDALKEAFLAEAEGHFGSGWAWLVLGKGGRVLVRTTHDADNPIQSGETPLMTCDVWEHAYYIDYRNERPEYLKAWWNLVNWEFVEQNLVS